MANKITHIKPKVIKRYGFVDENSWTGILDSLNTFYCPLSDDWTSKRVSSVDDAYIESLLAVSLVLKKQRKGINKKIKEIKTALDHIEENR